jgi:LemA protein
MTKLPAPAKETAGMTSWIVFGLVVLIGLWLIAVYNGLVGGRNQAQTAWSQIDVQLKRRHDLIPNLVQVVKDAMGYEQETLTKVIQARNAAVAASGPAQAGVAEATLTQATRGLLGLVESYPQLKANDNIRQLQEELTGTENKIAFARQFYNDSVAAYNTRRQSFPAVLAAASLGFGPIDLFNMPESEKEVPTVALR